MPSSWQPSASPCAASPSATEPTHLQEVVGLQLLSGCSFACRTCCGGAGTARRAHIAGHLGLNGVIGGDSVMVLRPRLPRLPIHRRYSDRQGTSPHSFQMAAKVLRELNLLIQCVHVCYTSPLGRLPCSCGAHIASYSSSSSARQMRAIYFHHESAALLEQTSENAIWICNVKPPTVDEKV